MKKLITFVVAGLFALGLSTNAFASTAITVDGQTNVQQNVIGEGDLYLVHIQSTNASKGILDYIYSPSLYTHENVLEGLKKLLQDPYLGLFGNIAAESIYARIFEYQSSGAVGNAYIEANKDNINWAKTTDVAKNENIIPGRNAGITTGEDNQYIDNALLDDEGEDSFNRDKNTTVAQFIVGNSSQVEWVYLDGVLTPITVLTQDIYSVTVHSVTVSKYVSPIVLDMDGNGTIQASNGQYLAHNTIDYKNTVVTDFYGDGFEIAMEWVGANDGLLVAPKADGSVDMSCLFGTAGGFENGYEKLALYDTNKDGVISGNELNGLSVWQDANRDAKATAGEVKTCAELGITSIGAKHKNFASTFTMNGKTQFACDWWPSAVELRVIAAK